jgi:uncharacterized membrane protein/glutaredoxin
MAKPAKNKQSTTQPVPQAPLRKVPNWPLFVPSLLGMGLAAYLTYSAWQQKLVAGCAAGSACDVVLSSRWSTLFGMPTSFWGFLTYALLAAIAWNRNEADQWRWAWVVSLFGLLYSLYLTSISYFELQAFCPYCLTSLSLMALIFGAVTLQKPTDLPRFSWGPWLGRSVGGALIVILAAHLHYAGYLGKAAGPEDPWVRGLAEHLSQIDAKFYGASWCPHCAQQKELFGSSVKRIPYVECSPGGANAPQAQVCRNNGIQSYPTWIIKGQRYTGVQPLDTLAQITNFQYQTGKP